MTDTTNWEAIARSERDKRTKAENALNEILMLPMDRIDQAFIIAGEAHSEFTAGKRVDFRVSYSDHAVKYRVTGDIKDQIVNKVLGFCIQHHAFEGKNVLLQDKVRDHAAVVISDIIDNVIKFEVTKD